MTMFFFSVSPKEPKYLYKLSSKCDEYAEYGKD